MDLRGAGIIDPAQPSWTRVYSAPVEKDEREAAEEEAAFMKDAAAAWGVGGTASCSHDHSAEQRIFDLPEHLKASATAFRVRLGDAFRAQGQAGYAAARYRSALTYSEYAFPSPGAATARREYDRLRAHLGAAAAAAEEGTTPFVDWAAVEGGAGAALAILDDASLAADSGPVCTAEEGFTARVMACLLLARASGAKGEDARARALLDDAGRFLDTLQADGTAACATPFGSPSELHAQVRASRAALADRERVYRAEEAATARRMATGLGRSAQAGRDEGRRAL
jgi:hypothetical protein